MLPASNKGMGMNVGFPDPCLTPVGPALVPIPYPNIGMNAMAAPFSPSVFLTMMPALNMGSLIPMTMGDEAGAANVIFKMMGGTTVGNPKVLVSCLPATNLTCPSYGNLMNNPLGASLVPSITNVLFTYRQDDEGERLDDQIAPAKGCSPVRVRRMGGIGYIAITLFTSDAPARVHAALAELTSGGARTLVIDLRGCRGGDLDAAIDLASELLHDGAEIATIIDSDGDGRVVRSHRSFDWRLPVTILVDRLTASAAEVFAGALKHHGRATIAGERTYGKGSCQRFDGARLITVGECLLPGGDPIEGVGVGVDRALRPRAEHEARRV